MGSEASTGLGDDKARICRIAAKLESLAIPMDEKELSKKEYHSLFPRGMVNTPLGKVKLGFHQYEKLETKGRKDLLGPMFQTLNDPIFVLYEEKSHEKAKIYLKSFKNPGETKIINVVSVVVDIDGQAVAISTGKRREKQIREKIRLARSILYEKQGAPGPTIGTG